MGSKKTVGRTRKGPRPGDLEWGELTHNPRYAGAWNADKKKELVLSAFIGGSIVFCPALKLSTDCEERLSHLGVSGLPGK